MTDDSLQAHIERHRADERARGEAAAAASAKSERLRRILKDRRGIDPARLLDERETRLCTEFLSLLRRRGFPWKSQLHGEWQQITIRRPPAKGLRRLFVDTTPRTQPARDVLAEGYLIGMMFPPEGAQLGLPITSWMETWHQSVVRDDWLRLALEKSTTIYSIPDGCRVYLCTDGRIRNEQAGSIPPDYEFAVGGIVSTSWGDEYTGYRGFASLADLPLEDVLAVLAINGGGYI